MNWLFRDRKEPDERSRKGAELIEVHAGSSLAIQRLAQAQAERDRVVAAIRNTVGAMRDVR